MVGMITKGDITRGVLLALQKDYQVEEVSRYRASHLFKDIHSDRASLILRYRIKARDFIHGGSASPEKDIRPDRQPGSGAGAPALRGPRDLRPK